MSDETKKEVSTPMQAQVSTQRKPIFSVALFREGVAQLKLPALLMGITVVVLNALIPLVARLGVGKGAFDGELTSVFALAMFAIPYIYIAPIVLSLRLFNFGNARNRSDFYHSLPHTRISLWLSFLAAIAAWLIVTVVAAFATSVAFYGLFGARMDFTHIPAMIVFLSCGALYLCAATALAMTVTGTTLSNIVVTILITCFPRYVSLLFSVAVTKGVPNLPASYAGLFNIQLGNTLLTLFSAFNELNPLNIITHVGNMLYTLGWTAVLAGLGLWLFVRRRSEDADKSAPSRGLQLVYRVCVALISALAIVAIVDLNSGTLFVRYYNELWPIILLLGTLSAISFCVYELITTRSWKSLARALPSFALVIAITWAFWAIAALDVRYEASFLPRADQIAWVRVLRSDNAFSENNFLLGVAGTPNTSSNRLALSRTRISDPAVLRAVATQLKDFEHGYPSSFYDEESTTLLEIRTKGGRTAYRKIAQEIYDEYSQIGIPSDFEKALKASPEWRGLSSK